MRTGRRWGVTLCAAALSLAVCACEAELTAENYDRITTGMTRSEVEGILGPGTVYRDAGYQISGGGVLSGGTADRGDTTAYRWESPGKEVIITFKDDKVVEKTRSGF